MEWKSLDILNIDDEAIKDALSGICFDLGSQGVEDLEGSFFFDGSRESEKGLRVYFNDEVNFEHCKKVITEFLTGCKVEGFTITSNDIENRNWREEWKESYKPLDAGLFTVIPAWMTDHKTDKIKIFIEPKMAFGTGTHETTHMLLSQITKEAVEGKDVLDAGTGSGILAIGAVLLGAKYVRANDIEEESIDNSTENALLNNVFDKLDISLVSDDEYSLNKVYDTIFANINRSVLVDLMPSFAKVIKDGGELYLSGILTEEHQLILNSIKENGFIFQEIREEGEWCSIKAKRF
ncbi:MAG: 50S ribosomal protein L11 methyltransferase [Candidatus Delongbacteria bacterium]|nr:50S ribosomal protein L11 methyltransferase [Candidatus Delongbacteria bacterium]MBN2835570.1 50S ribosomal protein L11 methyltransferase [Candidatus Delongbacteria bacterium]